MDKKYWNRGTPPEQLMEECAEVIQIVCKCLRFGWHNWHPEDPKKTPNYDLVLGELNDLEKRIYEFRRWMEIFTGQPAVARKPKSKEIWEWFSKVLAAQHEMKGDE